MKYIHVDEQEYKRFTSELKYYCTVKGFEEKLIIGSGLHCGYIAGFKDVKGYHIDADLLK